MTEAVVQLLERRWGSLSHPDGANTALAGYTTDRLPEAQAEVVGRAGKRLAESIVYTVETEGWSIVQTSDLTELQARATDIGQGDPIRVNCMMCGTFLFTFTMVTPGTVQTNPGAIAAALAPEVRQCAPECPSRSMG